MLDLIKLIDSKISPICSCYAVYPAELPKVYPYAEIKFPNVLTNNTYAELNLLEISIWDNKGADINEIETITNSIDTALNRLKVNDSTMQVCIYRNNPYRLQLNDPEVNIQRRILRYVVKVYRK